MNIKNIGKSIKHAGRVTSRFLHKHGPAIATGMSTVATIGGTIWACKKTLKVQPRMEEYRQEREALEGDKKAIRKSYISEAGYLAKEFAGPAASLVAGEALKVGAVVSLERTVGEMALGIAALQTQVKDLQKDLANAVGDEAAMDISHGVREEVEEDDDESPEKNIYTPRIKGLSPYAVVFDENHPWWKESPMYRYKNFHEEWKHLNNLLINTSSAKNRRRTILMNYVYERLKYKDTELGSHSGWFFDPKNHPEVDNKIDFIFVDPETGKRITEFPEGITKPVYLDFNVDYGYVTQFMEVC